MNLSGIIELVAKYAPVAIGIVQREGPAIAAFLKDLQALQSGTATTAVIPPTPAAPVVSK
jgi:hypothetical protein